MRVKYIGHKKKFPVYLPIGVKNRGGIKSILWADPYLELSEADARQLVAMTPRHFVLVEEQVRLEEPVAEPECEIAPVKRGRKKKLDA